MARPIVLVDPAGHAKELGRLLVEGYERAETLKFARALGKRLEEEYRIRLVVSREPGEEIASLQIPSFSNRLPANFFLRIHMYREENEKPQLFLYHHMANPFVDLAKRGGESLALVPLHQAHFASIHRTRFLGSKMHEYLNQEEYRRYFDCHLLQGMPLRPLVGITAPAVLLEIGICRENKWKSLVEPVFASLQFLSTLEVEGA